MSMYLTQATTQPRLIPVDSWRHWLASTRPTGKAGHLYTITKIWTVIRAVITPAVLLPGWWGAIGTVRASTPTGEQCRSILIVNRCFIPTPGLTGISISIGL